MSKKKMKDKVSPSEVAPKENRKERRKRLNKEKRKWSNPKDFKFLRPVKWLPGFRSGKHWKRIAAIMYFCVTPTSLLLKFGELNNFGIYVMILLLTMPFMLCSLSAFLSTKDKFYAKEALIAAAVFGADNIALAIALRNLMN